MICYSSKPIVVKAAKGGMTFPAGSAVNVTVPDQSQPYRAQLEINGQKISTKSIGLYRYFKEFCKPKISDRMMTASSVPSLTGERVEPDGFDSNGFPSVLLAAGYL